MTREEEIDPQLPYIQVHRSVGAKAAQLAPVLNVSYQHARGSLEVFWEGLADRRVLLRALQLPQPAIILSGSECRLRLQLAFGLEVDLALMMSVGFLEELGENKYRVRGMSRYLYAEIRRQEEAQANSARGKKRAATARRDARGRLVAGAPAGDDSSQPPADIQPPAGERLVTTPAGDQPATSKETRDERLEVRSKSKKPPPYPPPPSQKSSEPPADEDDGNFSAAFWDATQDIREEEGLARERDPPGEFKSKVSSAEREVGLDGLMRAFRRYLQDPDFAPSGWPMGVFLHPRIYRPRAHDRPTRDQLTGAPLFAR